MHGFALNVNPDLSYFDHIVPCGMPDGVVTSMAAELSEGPQVDQVVPAVARRFGKAFGGVVEWVAPSELGPDLAPAEIHPIPLLCLGKEVIGRPPLKSQLTPHPLGRAGHKRT